MTDTIETESAPSEEIATFARATVQLAAQSDRWPPPAKGWRDREAFMKDCAPIFKELLACGELSGLVPGLAYAIWCAQGRKLLASSLPTPAEVAGITREEAAQPIRPES